MSDQEINDALESHISQPQWLSNDFMVGEALGEGDCFFDALAQGMNLLSHPCGPFSVKSLRQACSDYAKDHEDWCHVIAKDANMGGYATGDGQQADFDSYLVRIKLTAEEMSVLKTAGPAIWGRPNIEGCMLCQKYGIKLHLIEKHTTDSQEVVVHQLVEISGSKPVSVDENVSFYNQPGIVHILSEGQAHFLPVLPKIIVRNKPIEKQGHWPPLEGASSQQNQLDRIAVHPVQSAAPVSGIIHPTQILSLSHPLSPKRKSDLVDVEENAFDAKRRSVGLPEETETFQASGAKSSLHGVAYQWKLLMLFAQKSQQLGYDFRLATEMNEAEKFDDVVLQYVKEGSDVMRCRFLQAKHIQAENERKRITAKDLLVKEKGPFSLQKYFLSYQKIKRNLLFQSGELQDFIICTNKDFDFDDGFKHQSLKKLCHTQLLYLEPVTEADEMLSVGGERYRLVSRSHPERQAVVFALKSLFEEMSEWRKLVKELAQHVVNGKPIQLHGLFNDYHMPLASCVFNIRDNKLATEFVEGNLDDQLCPGAHAFREALCEAIEEERLKRQSTKQHKPHAMKEKVTHQCTDSNTFWKNMGECEMKFSDDFKQAFIPHLKPQLTDPPSLAEEIARLINTKETQDETINLQQGEDTIIYPELPALAGHVFVKQDEKVVFSHKFLTGSSLAGNIQDLWNALFKVLEVNKCQELKYKLSNCTFKIANFETCKERELKGLLDLQVTDEEVEEFLDCLIFAVNQPNEERLSELISAALGHEFNLTDADLITSNFQSRILDWLKEKQGSYQSEKTMGKFFSDLREKVCQLILIGPTSEHIKTLQKYGLQFNDNVLPTALKEFLDSSHPDDEKSIFNFITDPKETFLGSIKVNQVMKGIDEYKTQGSFIFISLKTLLLLEEKALMAFRKEQSNLLIVECKGQSASKIQTLYGELSEIIKKRPGKKVILIAPDNHPLASEFKTGEHKTRYQEMVGKFKFGDLTSDSQKKLLEKTVKFQGSEFALNTLMSADSAITEMLPLVDLLEEKKLEIGQPVPVSNGYDEGYYIGRTFNYQSDKNPTSYPPENLDKLMLQAQRQKVMLISDTAGMGKTTVLTHLAKQIKQNFSSHWVVRIDLNDHADALKAQDKQKTGAVEFLSQRLLKLDSPLEKELFEQRLKEGKVVLMLDGFDEICPRYERTVIGLLQALKETSVEQLWVTTRSHLRKTLENNLQQLSYTLEPFSKGNQIEFLTKFWHQKLDLQGINQQQLEMYSTALIEKLEQSISNRYKEFTGVPLQTRLLAEAFKQSDISEHNLPDKLDLLDLYKRFTERKYDIYQDKKFKNSVSTMAVQEQRENDFKPFTEEHQRLALQVLFPKEVAGLFKDNSEPAFQAKQFASYGIVQYIDSKPHFIHHTFAEYYVADFLVNKLTKETTPPQELQNFLLKDILLKENYQVIGSFLDGFLENSKPSKQTLEQFGKRICELWKDYAGGCIEQNPMRSLGGTFLHQAAQVGHTYIIRYLLDSLKAGQHLETVHELLLAKDNMGQTAWHLSAETGHVKTSEELWYWAKEAKVNLKDDLLLAKDKNGQTAWHLAAWNSHPEVLKKLLKWADEIELSQQELKDLLLAKDKEGQTVWHLAAWNNYPEIFKNLMEWAGKANLSQEEFKAALLDKGDGERTPWHSATLNNHPEVYEWATEAIKSSREQKELLKELFLDKVEDEQTIWHLAARSTHPDVFKKLLDMAEEVLSQEEIRQLLLTKDTMGQTAWHLSAENGRAESLSALWEWAKKVHLNQNELKNNWLLSQDSRGTAWHLAAHRGHVTVLKKLWDWAKEANLDLREDLLLVRDVLGRTACHLAAESGSTKTLEEIFDWAQEAKLNFKADLLLAQDKNGKTAWTLAAERVSVEVLEKLWGWAKEAQLNPDKLKNNWLLGKNSDECTPWHLAAQKGEVKVLEKLWDWAKEAELNLKYDLLLSKNVLGQTSWHLAAGSDNVQTLEKLWEWAEEAQLNPKNDLLLAKGNRGYTAWHLAAESGHIKSLEKLWEWGKIEKLNPDELKHNFYLAENVDGNTAWILAAQNVNVEVLEKLWGWAKEVQLTPDELKNNCLLAKHEKASTAWHLAAQKGQIKVLEKLWDWGKEVKLNMKDDMLLARNMLDQTAWHLAAAADKVEALKRLWEWAKEVKVNQKHDLLLAEDKREKTAWLLAAESGHIKTLEELWMWAKKEKINPDELKNRFLLAQDRDGQGTWTLAAEGFSVELLAKLLDWAKEVQLNQDELKNKLLLAKDNRGRTAWHVTAQRGHIEVLEKLWNWTERVQLNNDELKNEVLLAQDNKGQTAWHVTAQKGHVEMLEKLWNWAKKVQLNQDELKNKLLLAQDSRGRTTWHVTAQRGHIEVLEKLWVWAKELQLNQDELKDKLLLAQDNRGQTAWHVTAVRGHIEVLEKLWYCAKEAKLDLLYDLLLTKNDLGLTVWHLAAANGKLEALKTLWEWAEDANINLKNDLLLAKTKRGNTAWHLAAENGHVKTLEKLFEWAKKVKLSQEEIRDKLLLAEDNDGQTAWILAAKQVSVYILEKLWGWSKEAQVNQDQLQNKLLLAKGNMGQTAWHLAAQRCHIKALEQLWDWAQEAQLTQEKLRNDLLLDKDKNERTAWHLSSERGHVNSLEQLWNWAKEAKVNLKDDLLLAKDKNGQTAWHLAAWNNHPEVLKKLLKWADEIELSQQELKDLLLAKDKEGQTVWHLTAWNNYPEVFQNLMEWAGKANLRQQEFKAALLDKDNEGRTPWHLATLNNHPEVYKWATEAIKSSREQEELLKELFLDKVDDEQTIWHLAARSTHPDVFKKLLEVAEGVLSQEEIRQLLLTKDTMGQTAWHLSAENGRAESLSALWEWAEEVRLKQNELKNNWLLSQDSRGTAWHLAAHRGHVTVLKKLWDWAKKANLNLREDLLLVRDVSGRTAWHLAAEGGKSETLEAIFDWAKEEKLNFENDLLLAKDRNGQTPLEVLKDCPFIAEVLKSQVLQRWHCYLRDD